jgi:hypothetical protein
MIWEKSNELNEPLSRLKNYVLFRQESSVSKHSEHRKDIIGVRVKRQIRLTFVSVSG